MKNIYGSKSGQVRKWSETTIETIRIIKNPDGATLGCSASRNVLILTIDGYTFKDLNRDDKLEKYEDWRLSPEERAKDLASKMSLEQIAGLMPLQMRANMRIVEEQYEYVPFDMKCHTDSEGNAYNYTFGLNWHGVINDARTRKYRRS